MTWAQVGWIIIALGVVLLVVLSLLIKNHHTYQVRKRASVRTLLDQRVTSIERGEGRQVVLGDRFWSRAYPALGLHALAVLPNLVSLEDFADGKQAVSAGSGELVLFARQIVQGRYKDGFSAGFNVTLLGPTPLSFLAGLLPEIGIQKPGLLAIFGNFGSTAPLWTEAAIMKGGHAFAAAGSISAQAALFLNMRDLLIGEEVFLLPGLIETTSQNQAAWITEDILRVSLIVIMVVAVVLKMVGVL